METMQTDSTKMSGAAGRIRPPLARYLGNGFQGWFFVLLIVWLLMPVAFIPIRNVVVALCEQNGITNKNAQGLQTLIGYARYFYIAGGVTVLAALVWLSGVLPAWRDWKRAARLRPWNAALGFMLFWSVLSTLASGNPISRIWGDRYHNDGLASYFIYAAVYVCALYLSSPEKRLLILRGLTSVATMTSSYLFGQVIKTVMSGVEASKIDHYAMVSVFHSINHFAYFLTLGILCTAGLWLYDQSPAWRPWYAISAVFQSYALMLNSTLGSFLAVLFALPVAYLFFWRSGRKLRPALFVPLVIYLLLAALHLANVLPGENNEALAENLTDIYTGVTTSVESGELDMGIGTGRLGLWLGALEKIARRPIFGWGPDALVAPSERNESIRVHNEFLQHAMLLGIPALAAYLTALFSLAAFQWKRIKEVDECSLIAAGAVVGYLFSSFFGLTMFYTAPYFFLVLGMTAHVGAWDAGASVGTEAVPAEDMEAPSDSGAVSEDSTAVSTDETEGPEDSTAVSKDAAEGPSDSAAVSRDAAEGLSDSAASGDSAENPAENTAVRRDGGENEPVWKLTRPRRALAAAACFAAVCVASTSLLLYREAAYEREDLHTMQAALYRLSIVANDLPSGEGWYDAENRRVIPVEEPAPAPCGKGTRINSKLYMTGEISGRGYLPEVDYRDCVLRMRVVKDEEGNISYFSQWVHMPENVVVDGGLIFSGRQGPDGRPLK